MQIDFESFSNASLAEATKEANAWLKDNPVTVINVESVPVDRNWIRVRIWFIKKEEQ